MIGKKVVVIMKDSSSNKNGVVVDQDTYGMRLNLDIPYSQVEDMKLFIPWSSIVYVIIEDTNTLIKGEPLFKSHQK